MTTEGHDERGNPVRIDRHRGRDGAAFFFVNGRFVPNHQVNDRVIVGPHTVTWSTH